MYSNRCYCHTSMNFNVSTHFPKTLQYHITNKPSSRSRFVPRGQTEGRTDNEMTKLITAFRNSANAHTKGMDTATDGLHLSSTAAPYFYLLYDNKLT